MPHTLSEHDIDPGERQVSALAVVLNYDDLLAVPPAAPFLLSGRSAVRLTRAETGATRLVDGCALELADAYVSVDHALLEPVEGGFRLVDRDSRNGTYVGGARVEGRRLQDHDLLEVGHTLLCYRRLEARLLLPLLQGGPPLMLGPCATRSPETVALVGQLRRVASSPDPLLLLGETGTGKEVAARFVHQESGRPGELRAVDCGAVPESLFESTFFGHRRGAFTGAAEPRTGELALAHRGTLFLDEVANLSFAAQGKLLRALETGQITPLGASEAEQVDLRLVSATNRDLLAERDGFREDLLNRLCGFVVRLPPLRQRHEDLGLLSRHFLAEAGARQASIRPAAGRSFFAAAFPGNLRQLRASLRSALLLAGSDPIETHHLVAAAGPEPAEPAPAASDLSSRGREPGAAEIEAALARAGGNVARAARELSVHARQLYRWMERLQLDPDKFRGG